MQSLLIAFAIALLVASASLAGNAKSGRAVHHSTDFVWKANQDVTETFTKALTDGTLKAGDELVLNHMYRINITDEKRPSPGCPLPLRSSRQPGLSS